MEILTKKQLLSSSRYYETHMKIVNIVLQLNLEPKELQVLAAFMSLDKKILEGDVINSFSRKKVREQLEMSPASVTNHLRSLISKGMIIKDDFSGRYYFNEAIIAEDNKQKYNIILMKDENQ